MQSQRLTISQQQKLKMSPQLYQSIKLMAMPLADLQIRVKEELEKNPALEAMPEKSDATQGKQSSEDGDWDPFENSSDPGYTTQSKSYSDKDDSKRMFLEGAFSRSDSLAQHLIDQLHLLPLSEKELEIGDKVIYNLDEKGFHREDPVLLIAPGEEEILEKLIVKVQHLEPLGCAAWDYKESLMIQAAYSEDSPLGVDRFLEEGLDNFKPNKKELTAKELDISMEELHEILDFLKGLNPFPGSLYSSEPTDFIVPDLNIRREEGEIRIYLNDSQIPELKIDEYFDEITQNKEYDKEARNYANNHVKEARWFINSIDQRNKTLLKTAKAIVSYQAEFFRRGPRFLAPLTLKDVASEIGVHEATVSRITTNKYVQTEWGIVELKYFFTNSISGSGSSGSQYSKEAVKLIIKEIIEGYTGTRKLSDQKISDALAQRGISLARRTVTKYRKELDIDSSFHR